MSHAQEAPPSLVLRVSVALSEIPPDLRPEAVEAVLEFYAKIPVRQPPEPTSASWEGDYRALSRSLTERDSHYAISSKDLLTIGESSAVAAALCTIFKSPLGIIGGLVVILIQCRQNRIKIDGKQAVVLQSLRRGDRSGLTFEELMDDLPFEPELDQDEVSEILQTLSGLRAGNSPVVEQKDNKWTTEI